jgi:RimJ/RimL family protein N-acetyltransferase
MQRERHRAVPPSLPGVAVGHPKAIEPTAAARRAAVLRLRRHHDAATRTGPGASGPHTEGIAMTSSNTRPEDLDLFRGDLVRLDAFDLERDVAEFAAWHADPKFQRLGFDQPIRPLSTDEARALMERWRDDWPGSLSFAVHALDDDRLVGLTRLYDIEPNHRTAILGISIGRESEWGKGFGTDASKVTIRYGFQELNLHRIWLDVFGYNDRAQALYRKLGFSEEGRLREHFERDGRRHDVILMGLLRNEWKDA